VGVPADREFLEYEAPVRKASPIPIEGARGYFSNKGKKNTPQNPKKENIGARGQKSLLFGGGLGFGFWGKRASEGGKGKNRPM